MLLGAWTWTLDDETSNKRTC
ncbi:hypothetical protein PG990_015258 [Apiospora arundinis]|uniref:Uncharacterized protein n=1 Tax=Apiospora arundinis TaxID=335852 RepID=A0ABR2HLN8_9PEZI